MCFNQSLKRLKQIYIYIYIYIFIYTRLYSIVVWFITSPENLSLDAIKEQLAIYHRAHCKLRKDDETVQAKKRNAGLGHAQNKKIEEYVQTHNIIQKI